MVRTAAMVIAALLGLAPAGATQLPRAAESTQRPVAAVVVPASTAISARSLLFRVPVRSEAGTSTYERTYFRHWIDADRDGCDTREEILIARSRVAVSPGAGCRVSTGHWYSYYDDATWTASSDVDIDHVVALKEAWESGARHWSTDTRTRFANDLGYRWSLEAVTDNVNASKGDRDPAQWLPPKYRCTYATRWVAVKYRWRLSMDSAEREALSSLLSAECGAKMLALPPRAL